MLTAFYLLVAVCALFVILSLQVVRAHEKTVMARKEEARKVFEETGEMPLIAEEEFFASPIYKAMEVIAHM